jgi:hypothetical protein
MKKIALVILILILHSHGNGQNAVIKGYVVDGEDNTVLKSASIFFNENISTVTDENGYFKLSVPQKSLSKRLKIRYLSYFGLDIINLPLKQVEINLDTIKLFFYFTNYPIDYVWPTNDKEDKQKNRQVKINEENRMRQYYLKRDSIIASYRYYFQENEFKIDLKKKYINLMKKL